MGTTFVISPRGAAKSAALKQEFPALVRVAGSNQEVVDAVDCVVLGVLPKQAETVLGELHLRPNQQLLSLVAMVSLARLRELVGVDGVDCARAIPMPAVAKRRGASLVFPPRPFAQAIFDELGTCVAVDDEARLLRMQVLTTLMGDYYKRQLTAARWLEAGGISATQAAAWVGAAYATISADSTGQPGSKTFEELVEEQTPGGLNEQLWKEQEADGGYEALTHSLDHVLHRLQTGAANPDLAPAAKRKRLK